VDSESPVTETKPPCPAGYERVRAGMKLIQLGVAGIALIIVLFALLTSTLQAEPLLLLWGLGASHWFFSLFGGFVSGAIGSTSDSDSVGVEVFFLGSVDGQFDSVRNVLLASWAEQ